MTKMTFIISIKLNKYRTHFSSIYFKFFCKMKKYFIFVFRFQRQFSSLSANITWHVQDKSYYSLSSQDHIFKFKLVINKICFSLTNENMIINWKISFNLIRFFLYISGETCLSCIAKNIFVYREVLCCVS